MLNRATDISVDDLCYLTARDVLRRFASRQLSPVDYLEALISRYERINPMLNAVTDTAFDTARVQVQNAEIAWRDGSARALEGLPIAIKDTQRVAGQRSTHGSLIFEHNIELTSDPMVERLLAAGAVIHMRTTNPEFCLSGVCHSRLWGVTVNPFNRAYGPGGSSGGSGAVLAAGLTPIASGTDIGGSIRIPASCCGLVGYKPPHGRNPDGPPACFDRYNHCGVLARSVDDVALVQNLISGAHPLDHDSLRERVTLPVDEPIESLRGTRLAWSMNLGYVPIDPEVEHNTLQALNTLSSLGCELTEVKIDWSTDIDTAAMHWYLTMHFGRQCLWHLEQHRDLMTDYAIATAEMAAERCVDDVAASWDMQFRMYQTIGPIFEQYEALLCPTLALPAVAADHDPVKGELRIRGQQVDLESGWVLTHPFNMLHNCPAISVPSGFSSNGVPTGLQIVGPTFEDRSVFRIARAFEAAVGGWFTDPRERPGFARSET